RRKFVKTGIGGIATIGTSQLPMFGLLACSTDSVEVPENNGMGITGVSLPSVIDVPAGGEMAIIGKGFEPGDQIQWTSTLDATKILLATITTLGPGTASLVLPDGIKSGGYRLVLSRDGETLALGTLQLNVVADTDIPDREGKTVKGIVYCNG